MGISAAITTGITDLTAMASKIRERLEFIKIVIPWIDRLVAKQGKELSYHEGSCHTNIVAELKNFGGFSFKTDTGQSMMGGNSFQVWYHPGKDHDDKSLLVLSLYCQVSVEESAVRVFDTTTEWQKALLQVRTREGFFVRQIKEEQKRKSAQIQAENKKADQDRSLLERAKKLGF